MASASACTARTPVVPCRAAWQPSSRRSRCDFGSRPASRPRQRASRSSSLLVSASQPLMTPRTQDMAGDPFGLLLRQRIIFLGGEVTDFAADAIVSQLLLLDAQDATRDIKLFINSPGGSVTAGMGIYDAMQLCRADIQTYCFGLAASMGAFLLCTGAKGKRYSMPNARIMIHQPLGGASGQAVDIEIQAKEIMYHKANLNRIMSDATGQPIETIEEDTDRDRYMSPLEAKNYGLIDHIVGGEEAVFKIVGNTKNFPKTRREYIAWGDEDNDGSRSERFLRPAEPYTQPVKTKE
ncbi:CLPP4 [Auxenochlorella protothecoides x Auxenochlorella symbiontica]